MAIVTQLDDKSYINEFGGLVTDSGHKSDDIMIKLMKSANGTAIFRY